MHILLTNDDGISAPGLMAIYKQLRSIADVTVVAPQNAQSGAGHSITLEPLTYSKVPFGEDSQAFSVDGSPADCVKLAVNAIVDTPIDMVVSGINCGANVGIHLYYSGTVAAAMEAAFYNIPAISLSTVRREEEPDFKTAAEYSLKVIKKLLPASPGNVINVNIPDLTEHKPKGVVVVPHSTNGFDENYSSEMNGDGQTFFTFIGCEHRDDDVLPLDTNSLADGFITITSLHCDLTDYQGNFLLDQIDFNDLNETNQK